MAKNRQQFTLQFNADTSQAKKAIQDLNSALAKIQSENIISNGIDTDLKRGAEAAKILQSSLQAAMNVDTGKLNLNAFNQSLKQSGQSLQTLSANLLNAGSTGTQAFTSLARSIASAEVPLKKMNQTVANMMTTLKNTVKWELSSIAVHGLESALSGAVSYVKDLNGSLNDIRIVTGQSAEDMAKFAIQANKAAKELSTTTKAYADASLIYYQQGDTQEQAAKKAAITIKAANASFNTSAAEMSEYLTAVWNSYQVGADELERYVDIMAALGAKTATSLEEIATSMQKVAATGHTVGVSMEQVSSIIATVSSVTRESAESIGTSYKTIFARIGDLKLGGTTEDGIGLGQVSSQLDSIGVQILDTSGNLRDMGDIITDLGNKWQTMSEAQKVATAQVVAGKRQYTQLMALFENWDMYNQNLNIAETANGELDKQAAIHAESWEAAAARVKVAWEGLFSSLIDENVLISFANGLEKIVSMIKGVADSFGGMSGVLTALSSVALNVFSNQIAGAIDNVTAKISGQKNEVQGFADTYEKQLASLKGFQDDTRLSESQKVELQYTTKIMEMNSKLQKSSGSLTDAQISGIQGVIKQLEQERELYTGILRLQETINKESSKVQANKNDATKNAIRQYGLENNQNYDYLSATQQSALDAEADTNILLNILTQTGDEAVRLKEALGGLKVADDMNVSLSATLSKVQALTKASSEAGRALAAMGNQGLTSDPAEFKKQQAAREDGGVESAQANFLNTLNGLKPTGLTEFDAKVDELRQKLSQPLDEKGLLGAIKEFEDLAQNGAGWDEAVKKFKDVGVSLGFLDGDKFDKWIASLKKGGADAGQVGEQIKDSMTEADKAVEGFMQKTSSMSQRLVSFASGLTGLTTLFNGFKNGIETIFSGDTSGAEKLGAVISLITTATYGYVSATKLLTAVLGKKRMAELASQAVGLKSIVITTAQTTAEAGQTGITLALAVAKKVLAGAIRAVSAAFKALSSNSILLAFTAIVAVIGAAIGAVNSYKKHQEELAKQNRETAKSRLEQIAAENKALQEESENVDKAYNAYEQMEQKRKESGEATDEYTTAVDSVLEALGREELKILATTGRYEELAEAIRKANEERIQQNGLIVQGNADASHAAADALFTNYDTDNMTYVSGTGKKGSKYYYIDGPGDEIRSQIDQADIIDPRTGQTVSGYSILAEMGFTYDSEHDNLHIANPTPENLERVFENMQMLFEIMPGLASLPGLKEVWEIMQSTGGYIYDAENAAMLHGGNARLTAMYGSNPDDINYNALYQSTGQFLQEEGYITDLNDPNASKLIDMVIKGYITSLGEDFNTELQTFTLADANLQQLHLPPEFIAAAQEALGNSFWEYLGAIVDPSVLDVTSPEAFISSLTVHGQQGQKNAELNRVMTLPQRIEDEKTKVGTYDDANADRATVTAIFEDYYGSAEAAAPMLAAYFSATAEGQLAMLEAMGVGSAEVVQTAWDESVAAAQGSLDTLKTGVNNAIADLNNHSIFEDIVPEDASVDNIADWVNDAQQRIDAERNKTLALDEARSGGESDVGDIAQKYGVDEEWLRNARRKRMKDVSLNPNASFDYTLSDLGLYTIDELNVAQASLDAVTAQNDAYIGATAQATASMDGVSETEEQIVKESKAYENFNKISGFMDKSSLTKVDTWATLADITGKDVETLQTEAASQSDAQWSASMLSAAETQLGKIISASDFATLSSDEQQANTKQVVSDAEYAAAQAQLDEMRATNAETQFESSTRATETAIELAEKYADVLGNLSADSLKSLGANEWEQLGKAIGKTSEEAQAYFKGLGSESKVIDELKNAQINQLQTAADEYGVMANEAAEQRDKFAPNSEEYLLWEERRLQYIDQQTEALLAQDEVEREALNAKKELWEEAYAQQQASQEKDIENLKEQKAALDLLSKALETGALTDSERQTLSDVKIDVDSWDKLSTAEQRANWLAAEYSKVLTKIQAEIEAIAKLDESKISTITEDDLATAESFAAALEEIEGMDEATKGAWMAAYEAAAELGPVTIDSLKNAAKELPETYQQELEASKDGIMDIIREMYASTSEENRQSAEQAVNDWENAFNRIAALRKKILAGENIAGDIFGGSMDQLWQNFLDSGYTDYSQFSQDVKTGAYNPTLPTFDVDEWRTANGLDAFAVLDATGAQEITREDLVTHYGAQVTQQEGESDTDFAARQSAYVQEEINTDVKALLGAYQDVDKTNYDIDEVLAAFNDGDTTTLFMNAQGEMVTAAALINDAADTMYNAGTQMSADMLWYQQQQEIMSEGQGIVADLAENQTYGVGTGQANQEELLLLQAAIQRAQEEKYTGEGDWNNLSSADQELLSSYGIGFDNVDMAAEQCANGLTALAEVAYQAMEAFLLGKGYEHKEDGWYDSSGVLDEGMTEYMDGLDTARKDAYYSAEDDAKRLEKLQEESKEKEWEGFGLDPDEVDEFGDHLQGMAEASEELSDSLKDNADVADEVAKEIMRFGEACKDVRENYEDWMDALESDNLEDQAKAIKKMDKAYSDMLDLDYDTLSDQFLRNTDNLELMKQAAEGSEEAYNSLQEAARKDIAMQVGLDDTAFQNQFNNLLQQYYGAQNLDDIEIGAALNDAGFLAALSRMVTAAGMTAEQATDYLASMGVDATVRTKKTTSKEIVGNNLVAHAGVRSVPYTVPVDGGKGVRKGVATFPYVTYTSQPVYATKETEAVALEVTSAHKSSGGAFKFDNSSAASGSGSGGGGGGGGGGTPKTLDVKDPNNEKQRYFQVDNALERMADALEKVDKLKRRAFGEGYLKNLDSEISLLKQEIGLQQEYINQAKEWLAFDRNRVASLGATFDGEGDISNYNDLMDSIIAKYNAFIEKYNAASASAQEDMEEEKEEMDEWFDEAIEWISQYEDTLALVYDKENELLELQNQISEKTLEKIQYKIEYKVEFNQSELDFLEYINDAYDEMLEKQDLIMDNYVRQGQIAEQNLSYLATAKKELEAAYASGDLTSADYVEGLQDIQDQTLENLEAIQDVKESIDELYGDTLDLAGEQLDKHTAKIDSATEAMKSYMSILQLMGKGTNYEDLLYFYDKQYDYNVASLEAQVNYLNVLKEEEQYYLDRMNTAEGLTETEREQYEALIETLNDANSTMLSSTEETLQNIKEMYDTTIENIMRKLEQSMTGMDKDLAWLTEEYGFYTEEMEQYVSASRELYEVSKLNRNIQNSINDTTSKVHKQKLKELQDEINAQSELKELSEYEIEMLNLKYELLLKQIALEEAQNAKSTVRLTRDSEGNMIYQYTADQDAINQAQQEYEDVLQQMSDLNYETENNIYSQTLQLRQETLESIKEIAQDETLTEEQKQARIAEIMEHYYNQAEYLQEQYGIVMENTTTTNKLIAEHYGVAVETLSKNTQESISAILSEMINNSDNYKTEMQMAYEEIKEAMQSYSEKIAEVTQITNTSYGDMIDSVKTYDEITNDANKETADLTSELKKQVNQLHDSTSAWDTYYKKIQNVTKEYGDMYSAIQKAIVAQGQLANASAPSSVKTNTSVKKTTDKTLTPSSSSGGSGSGGNGGSGGNSGSKTLTNQTTISGGGGRDGLLSMGSRPSSNVCYTRYATGGLADYTGPAWVDGTAQSPELVLNSSDTQNMLNIVDTVRRLDKTTLSMMDEFINLAASSMMSNLFQIHAGSANGNNQTELEQNVHITAEFPNVQDSNEIQDAFDNLVNRAAQYIGSKKK